MSGAQTGVAAPTISAIPVPPTGGLSWAACVQMLGGRTITGKKAQVAWLTVHLALLPTNEDRAKALVDWAGATLTHERAGRITVESR